MFFQTILVAFVAILFGLTVCFAGFRLFVILLPIWAFFAGLLTSAESIQELFGGGFLATISSWVFGLVIGVIFAVAAYFFYYAALVILALTVGFQIGSGLLVAVSVNSGVLQFLVGLALGLVLAVAVVILNLPKALIVVLTAFGGASLIVAGFLLAIGRVGLQDLRLGVVGATVNESWFWSLIWFVVALIGIAVQLVVPDAYRVRPYGSDLNSVQAPTATMSGETAQTAPSNRTDLPGSPAPAS